MQLQKKPAESLCNFKWPSQGRGTSTGVSRTFFAYLKLRCDDDFSKLLYTLEITNRCHPAFEDTKWLFLSFSHNHRLSPFAYGYQMLTWGCDLSGYGQLVWCVR